MARLTALPDANVLYPAGLRDLLLRLADQCMIAPLWSADIHAEWTANLLADRPDPRVAGATRAVMDRHCPDALVTGYEVLAAELNLPDPGDRHVLAAATHGKAAVTPLPCGTFRPATWLPTLSRLSIPTPSSPICSRLIPTPCWQPFRATGRRCAIRLAP